LNDFPVTKLKLAQIELIQRIKEMGRGVSITVYDVVSSEILVSSALLGDADSNVFL